jgi:hypothetical protein
MPNNETANPNHVTGNSPVRSCFQSKRHMYQLINLLLGLQFVDISLLFNNIYRIEEESI